MQTIDPPTGFTSSLKRIISDIINKIKKLEKGRKLMALDQMKTLNQLRKAQNDLKKEIIEVSAGDGAVIVQITGEMKVKSVKLDTELIDFDDIEELENWIKIAVRDGLTKAQEVAAEKMKPLMGGLGNLGL